MRAMQKCELIAWSKLGFLAHIGLAIAAVHLEGDVLYGSYVGSELLRRQKIYKGNLWRID